MNLVSSNRKKKRPVSEGTWEERISTDKETPEQKASRLTNELGYSERPDLVKMAQETFNRVWGVEVPEDTPVFIKKAAEPEGKKTYSLPQNCTWCSHRVSETTKNGRKYSETETCGLKMLDPIPAPGTGDRWCAKFEPVEIPQEREWNFPKFFGDNIDETEGPRDV